MKLNMDNRLIKWVMNETNFVTYFVSGLVLCALMLWVSGIFITAIISGWLFYPYMLGSWYVLFKLLRPYVADTTEHNPEEK